MIRLTNISAIEQHVIDFVRELRYKENLTQENLATILNVKRSFINNVESPNDRSKYNLNHIDKFASHFGMSPKDFLPEKPTNTDQEVK